MRCCLFGAGLALLVGGCGPVVRADGPAAEPEVAGRPPVARPRSQVSGVLVGELCPTAAAGRPGIAPMFVRGLAWSDDPDEAEEPLARGAVRQFQILGQSGARAGLFTVMGEADAGLATDLAIGSYAGASACATADDPKKDDPACAAAQRGCGLAIAPVVPGRDAYSEAAELPAPAIGSACVSGDALVVDIDGDGAPETYPLAQFLDPVRAPADEVTASPVAAVACKGRFAWFDARVDTGAEPGAPADPRFLLSIDLLGVVDVDGDGRVELIMAFRAPDHRSVVMYSASGSASRLERVGEAQPWQPGS